MDRKGFIKSLALLGLTPIAFYEDEDKIASDKLIERLKSLSDEYGEWVGYYLTFNSWQFPIEFYDLIPSWWHKPLNEKPFDMKRRSAIIHQVMQVVKEKYGEKELLRYHNVNRQHRMTNDEFEFWWKNGGCDSEYYERALYMEGIHWWKPEVFDIIKGCNIHSNNAHYSKS